MIIYQKTGLYSDKIKSVSVFNRVVDVSDKETDGKYKGNVDRDRNY